LPSRRGSANKRQQVYLNLFLNARDAISPAEEGMIEVGLRLTTAVVEIESGGTGGGIAREHSPHL